MRYGTSSNNLALAACSTTSITYPNSRTWGNTVTLSDLTPGTTYYYKITSTNSTVEHFLSPRSAGDTGAFSFNAVIDLGVYGADGYTIKANNAKRDTIPLIQPSLNHTTIGRLANTIDDYEFVVHPGDLAYADDWLLKPKNLFDGTDAYAAIVEQFYGQLAPISGRKPYSTYSKTLPIFSAQPFPRFRLRLIITHPSTPPQTQPPRNVTGRHQILPPISNSRVYSGRARKP